MPLFLSEEEYERCSQDVSVVAEKADTYIRDLYNQLETVKAQADAASITAEQTCSLLEQRYVSLSSELATLQSHNSQLNSSLEQHLSDLAQVQADKHQLHLKSIGKDGDMERLSMEASELHKSKRQLIELLEHKDLEISEKNANIKSYLDKIANLTDNAALREARLNDIEAELSRSHASCGRLSQEKELLERHNVWLNDELTDKINCLIELRKTHCELEADLSTNLADVERKFNESSSSLNWNQDRVTDLELKLTSLQEDLCSSKDVAAANEERLTAEISTVSKLVELYKESSEEWSRKAGELEGVIKALETHLSQVENDYKEKLEKELSARKEFEKGAATLKENLEKCEAEVEASRKANELSLLPLSSFTTETWLDSVEGNHMDEDNRALVPIIPAGVSGTALAASLLRDGWSLAKMYAKYQEAVDALRHEQLGRKQSQALLERVLYEIEEKAEVIFDERAEHERLVAAYSVLDQKLQHSLSEQTTLERTLQHIKADLKRQERDYTVAQKEITDLQKQVTVLLKECRDIQIRCGSEGRDYAGDVADIPFVDLNADSDAEKIISERLLTFKDISGLVEQNVQLRSLVRSLSDQIENREIESKENLEMELQKCTDDAASKVNAVLARAEEQGRMIESLHTSVSMYKRLYEEEHKLNSSNPHFVETAPEDGKKDFMLLLEGCQESTKVAQERAFERVRCLEEDLAKLRSEIVTLRSERDRSSLESNFAREKLDRFMKEFEHQRDETNGVIARNVEFSQLIVDYQRKLREGSESSHAVEELSRKLNMEVSVLRHEKELLLNSEKRACDEVRALSERVHRLQATLDTIQSAEEVREEARGVEKRKQEEYVRQIEREWTEAKRELQDERDNVRSLRLEREETMKDAMRQVEEMGKELANALRAVADAEARAAVAEVRCIDLEKKIKYFEIKVAENDGEYEPSSSSLKEAGVDLRIAKDEIEKLRAEVQINKDHMLQYKSIAQVNEVALKQMESAYETFKIEVDKVKQMLEAQVVSLKERVNGLETECMLKSKEAASAATAKEEAISSAFTEIAILKDEISVKISKVTAMEMQVSNLKEDLENEHQKWRAAQTNYERQVIQQSETIQELTRTSQDLASLQEEASKLRKLADVLQTENGELKAKWEVEKLMLEESKNEADKKCSEINEQNKILHCRLEALHIKLAEKDRDSAGISGSSGQGSVDDTGLQNVVNYLRRSKEIAETEISLFKQEKLRLRSQLESALKAAETAQASLHAERANSRALIFNEEDFKSLQLQVREMNLLRESNLQLREENKHNVGECQKLCEAAQKARIETENLECVLRERQSEVEACRKEIEMQKVEKEHLEKRVVELLERCKHIDVKDYDRMKGDVQRMQVNLREKDVQFEEINKLIAEKNDVISQLEQDLAKSRMVLNERESRIKDTMQVEATLKSEVEKQKKFVGQLKKKSENLSKEKDELIKENQALAKQLEDSRQGKRNQGDAIGEQVMKEKEKEKDTRIQMLEKTVERQREDLKNVKEDHKTEKAKRLKTEKTIVDSLRNLTQERTKLVDEFEKHKQALKRLSDEVERLKHANSNLPEGTSAVQLLSATPLDDLAAAYLLAVEDFERVAHSVSSDLGASPSADTLSIMDASSSGQAAQAISSLPLSGFPSASPTSSFPPAKSAAEREKNFTLTKTNVETRKTGRKLVRPRITKPEEPQGDTEMSEIESQANIPLLTQHARKRLASSTSELQQDSLNLRRTSIDAAAPVLKKSKGSESPQDGVEEESVAPVENLDALPSIEESLDAVSSDLPQGSSEEVVDTEKDEVETTPGHQVEEPKADGTGQIELQNDRVGFSEEILGDKPSETELEFDDGCSKLQCEQDIHQLVMVVESGIEREEGELVPDIADAAEEVGGGAGNTSNVVENPEFGGDGEPELEPEPEAEPEPSAAPMSAPEFDEEASVATANVEFGEINSPIQVLNDEKNEDADIKTEVNALEVSDSKLLDDNDQVIVETSDQIPEAAPDNGVRTPNIIVAAETTQASPNSITAETEEAAKQMSSAGKSSTTINLQERARQRSLLRQAGVISSPLARGRGRAGRGGRAGGRGGRAGGRGGGQASGEQG